MHVNIIVDDEMKVYADGQLIGTNKNWHQTKVQMFYFLYQLFLTAANQSGESRFIKASIHTITTLL